MINISDPLLYDTLAIACVVVSVFLSLTKGLVREIVSLLEWVLTFWITYLFYQFATDIIAQYIAVYSVARLLGVASTFIVVLIVIHIIGKKIVSGLRTAIPVQLDYLGGIIFGFMRGALLPAIIFNLFLLFSVSHNMQNAIMQSYSYQVTKHISRYVFGVTPERLIERANKNLGQQL